MRRDLQDASDRWDPFRIDASGLGRGPIGKIRMAGSPQGRGDRIDGTPHMKDESVDEGAVEMDFDRVRSRRGAVGDAPGLRNPSVPGLPGLFGGRSPAVVLPGEIWCERRA